MSGAFAHVGVSGTGEGSSVINKDPLHPEIGKKRRNQQNRRKGSGQRRRRKTNRVWTQRS